MTSASVTRQSDLLERASNYLAGGGLGLFVLPDEVNIVIAEGHGSHVTDVSGRDFIDYHLGSGPALLGHAHPEVVAAVERQLPKGSTYYFLNEPVIQLAERMVRACPCADQVQFTGSGTEATFFALRMARAATGRDKVLKFEGGWHGMNDYGLWGTVPSQPSAYPNAEPDSVGIPDVLRGQVLVAPFNDAERAATIIAEHAHELAAVIVEPLERVLVPLDLSLRCSSTQNVDVETLSRIRSPSGSLQSTRQGAAFDGARLAFSGQGSRPRQTLL